MPTFTMVNTFSQRLANGGHNLNSDVLKLVLTNTAPSAGNSQLSDITQISNGNGYTTGGLTVANTEVVLDGSESSLVGDAVEWTASGGTIGPFRYWALYNDTQTGDPLIGFWDNGGTLTVSDGGKVKIRFDGEETTGVILTLDKAA